MKKKLLSTLLLVFALTIATFAFVFAGCDKDKDDKPSSTAGSYYLSVLEGDTWTKYSSDSAVPAAYKFAKDGGAYKLTVDLEEGDSVKIAQVGKTTTYGGSELFSTETQLTAGSDNAISVGETGKYVLTFDASDSTISYSFTPAGHVPGEATVVSVEIDDAADINLSVGGTKQLTATATLSDETTTDEGITWEIDDTTVATVSESGFVTAAAEGTTFIVAKCGDQTSTPVIINVTEASVPVSTIAFGQSSYAINLATGTATVSASVNSDATNQNVIYSTTGTGITIDGDGNVTATALGVYTITAKAAGDATKTATATVTVYSDFYICGEPGWAGLSNETTTVGTDYENYTFTANEDYTVFTLVYNSTAKFQILYLGGGWTNAITGANSTQSGAAGKDSQNNITISGGTGVYTITIENVYSGTPTVTATRTGDIPSFTATINGVSGTSSVANNRYNISVAVTLATASAPVITISGGASSSYTYPETLEAGTYRFDIVCGGDGNVISANAVEVEGGPVISTDYVLAIGSSTTDWGDTISENLSATLYYDGLTGEYTCYFSYTASAGEKFGFGLYTDSSLGTKTGYLWYNDLGSIPVTYSSAVTINGGNFYTANAGPIYGKLVFTVNGSTATFSELTFTTTNTAPNA